MENVSETINSSWGRLKYELLFHVEEPENIRKWSKRPRTQESNHGRFRRYEMGHLSLRMAELTRFPEWKW